MLMTLDTPKDWRLLEPHPIADLFPMMGEDDLQKLKDDIRENWFDQDRPIVLYEGKILDGRNRHRACVELDRVGELDGTVHFYRFERSISDPSPLDWVMSVNLNRRHLNEGQRAIVAAKIANMRSGERTDLAQICARSLSQTEAGKMMNVSLRSVSAAKGVLASAPDLAERVASGEKSLNAAEKEAKERRRSGPSAKPVAKPSTDFRVPRDPVKAARVLIELFTADEIGVLLQEMKALAIRDVLAT